MREPNGSVRMHLQHILDGPSGELEQARAEIISVLNIRRQCQNLKAFVDQFASNVESQFKMSQETLLAKFVELLNNLRVLIKIGGLDAYTGYWLASDSPATNSKDAWQEEGLDTLRRILLSASLPLSDPIVPDAFQYPFIAALVSPFGPSAILPFEEHLSASHIYYGHEAGGSWFKVPSAKNLNKAGGQSSEYWSLKEKPKGALSTFEEAELELEKLDL